MPTPKVARNLGTLTFHRYRENRSISTIPFQTLKYTQGNYVRHFWGTTPARRLSGTTTPHATKSTSSVRQHNSTRGTAPLTGRHTPYEALHPLRGTTPLTRRHTRYEAVHPLRGTAPDQKGCNAYGSGAAPPITRTNAESARRPPTHTRPRELALPGPSAFSDHQPAFSNRQSVVSIQRSPASIQQSALRRHQSAITNHQSQISSQQPLHNHQSTISRRSRWRRRGRLRR